MVKILLGQISDIWLAFKNQIFIIFVVYLNFPALWTQIRKITCFSLFVPIQYIWHFLNKFKVLLMFYILVRYIMYTVLHSTMFYTVHSRKVQYIMYTVLHSTMFYTVHNVPAVLYCTVQCTCILYSFVVCPVIPFFVAHCGFDYWYV